MNKKILIVVLAIFIVSTFSKNSINAFNALSCDNFEVAYIEDDGNFKMISCHNHLQEAKEVMKTNQDYVVRHRASDSPMDIVAMNSGIAYIYTHRYSDKATIGLWEKPYDKEYVQSYSDSYRDVFYLDTTEFSVADGEGTITGILNGFKGGIGLEYTDLVPDKFFRLNLPVTIGGGYRESAYSFIPRRSYYDVVVNGNYRDLVYHYFPGYGVDGKYSNHYTYAIGPAPDFMEQGKKYYSYNGYDYYDDMAGKNKVGTSYNYYQFLPLRSKSKINVESYNKFLKYFEINDDSKLYNSGQYFIDSQEKYGVNAALIFGVAVNESAFGRSYFARERNNLFGLNAVDADPSLASRYVSVVDCIETMFSYYVQSYIDLEDWRFFGSSLGNKGSGLNLKYASDPHWSLKAARYAYMLDKIDNDFNGKLTDYASYKFKKINKFDAEFKKEANEYSETLDTSKYGKTYQENFMVIPLESVGEYTKIQFTNPIENGKVLKWKDIQNKTMYNWQQSFAYIKTENLSDVFNSEEIQKPFEYQINQFSLNNNVLSIKGKAFNPNLNNNLNNLENYLIIKNEDQVVNEIKLNNIQENDVLIFNQEIILDLKTGIYTFEIKTKNDKDTKINSINLEKAIPSYKFEKYKYEIIEKSPFKLKITRINDIDINVKHYSKQVLNDIAVNEKAELLIDGLALIDKINFDQKNSVKHQLIIKNMETGNVETEALETYSYPINLQDGYIYDYIGYRGKIDLNQYRNGKYQLYIRIITDLITKEIAITSNNAKYDNIIKKYTDYNLRISSKQSDAFRIVVEKFNHNYYSDINKPSRRSSFVKMDSFDLDDNLLKLTGTGIIFETDMENVGYELLLIGKNESLKVPLKAQSQDFDLTKLLNSQYQINLSKFNDSFNIGNLKPDIYQIKFKLRVKQYQDTVDVELYGRLTDKIFENEKYKYEIKVSEIDNTASLLVKEK